MCPFCIASVMLAVGGVAAGGGLTALAGKLFRRSGKRVKPAGHEENGRTEMRRVGQAVKTA